MSVVPVIAVVLHLLLVDGEADVVIQGLLVLELDATDGAQLEVDAVDVIDVLLVVGQLKVAVTAPLRSLIRKR